MHGIPRGPTELLSSPSPVSGTVDEIDEVGACLRRMRSDCSTYRMALGFAADQLRTGAGAGIDAVSTKLSERLLPSGTRLQGSLDAARKGVNAYGSEVERIHRSAARVKRETSDCLDVIRESIATLEDIQAQIGVDVLAAWDQVPPGRMPTPVLGPAAKDLTQAQREVAERTVAQLHEDRWLRAASQWKGALERIDELQAEWERLVSERRSAEARLLKSLGATELGMLLRFQQLSGSAPIAQVIAVAITGEVWGAQPVGATGEPNPALDRLLAAGPSPAELAEQWPRLGLNPGDVERLPLETLVALAHAEGSPAWAQDEASTALLKLAIVDPEAAHRAMGFTDGDVSVSELQSQLLSLHDAWQNAKRGSRRLPGEPGVQLVGLGMHDGVPTAAISLGDLDTASRVAVNVSGMYSSVDGMDNGVKGAETLRDAAGSARNGKSYAVVTWIGYRSPTVLDVEGMGRARAGAPRLAEFIDGVYESRQSEGRPKPAVTVLGHSYGSTTAALALTLTEHPVENFVAYGSAGLAPGTYPEQLRAGTVYATEAVGDGWARVGRGWSHAADPRVLPGVVEFSSEGEGGAKRVTSHDMFTEGATWGPANWGGKVGYLSKGTSSATSMGSIIANGGLE